MQFAISSADYEQIALESSLLHHTLMQPILACTVRRQESRKNAWNKQGLRVIQGAPLAVLFNSDRDRNEHRKTQ